MKNKHVLLFIGCLCAVWIINSTCQMLLNEKPFWFVTVPVAFLRLLVAMFFYSRLSKLIK